MNRFSRICLLFLFTAICLGASVFNHYERIRRENVKPCELYSVINSQLKSLRTSDFHGAYLQVSSEFKSKCKIERFIGMIREDYPSLATVDHVEYGAVDLDDRHAEIEVYFIDRNDRVIPYIYTLVNEGTDWKIENVRLLRKKDARLMLTGMLS